MEILIRENRVKRSKSLPDFLCFYHKTRSFEGKDLERFSRLSRMRSSINRGTKRAIRGSHRKIEKIRASSMFLQPFAFFSLGHGETYPVFELFHKMGY